MCPPSPIRRIPFVLVGLVDRGSALVYVPVAMAQPGGNDVDLAIEQHLLERSRVMIGVAVGHDHSRDERRSAAEIRRGPSAGTAQKKQRKNHAVTHGSSREMSIPKKRDREHALFPC